MTEREHWHTAADGTRLFAREVGPLVSDLTPLLCLPGLTRNSRDFEPIFLQFGKTRRVIAMDFRGRGQSAYAADPMTYRPDVELQDTLGFLSMLEVDRVAVLGTSRGGIVGMLMAAFARAHLAGLMLNDIGCELQTDGLLRIKDYVANPVCYKTWEAVAHAMATGARGFADVSPSQWQAVAKRIYVETADGICPSHDPRLADTIPSDDDIRSGKVAELWSALPALHDVPFAVLRGEGSDLLAEETVRRMAAAVPSFMTTTIFARGHVPFLDEPESVAAMSAWLERVDLLN